MIENLILKVYVRSRTCLIKIIKRLIVFHASKITSYFNFLMCSVSNEKITQRNFTDFHRCSCNSFVTSAKFSGHVISIKKGSIEIDQIEGKLGKLFT